MPATTIALAEARKRHEPPPRTQAKPIAAVLAATLAALLALVLALQPAAAQGGRDPAYAEFYDTLDPHGEWVIHPRYGETWVPFANQDRGWRPYARGQWAFTEEHGWFWESEEEFGWVVYHYGRWLLDQHYGWMWVPGTEWGPAWVAWREGEDAIGWAPLPPEAELEAGPDGSYTFDSYASPRYSPMWMFVPVAMMTAPAIYRYFHPPTRNSFYFGRTRFVTHYSWHNRRIYNRGIDPRLIERHTRRPVPILQVRPLDRPRDWRGGGRTDGDRRQIGVYRPQLPQPPSQPGRPGWPRPPQGQPGQPAQPRGMPSGLPPTPGSEPFRQRPPVPGSTNDPGRPGPFGGVQPPRETPRPVQPPVFDENRPRPRPTPFGEPPRTERAPISQPPPQPPQPQRPPFSGSDNIPRGMPPGQPPPRPSGPPPGFGGGDGRPPMAPAGPRVQAPPSPPPQVAPAQPPPQQQRPRPPQQQQQQPSAGQIAPGNSTMGR